MKKKLITGIQPTGNPHIGNYFGSLKQILDTQNQDSFDTNVFIADFHAITELHDAAEIKKNSKEVAIDCLAIGLDPEKITLFRQSDVPEVTELAWILSCITTVPYLMRAHAFKDAEAKNKEISGGTFNYPVLMAADILLHKAQLVPVGKDQQQHIEFARDFVEKFNRIYGETFVMPEGLILEDVATVPGIDGRKMSKSYGNTISIFATDEEIKTAVMKIPTDSKGVDEPKDPDTNNIYAIHSLVTNDKETLRAKYLNGGMGYKEAKDALIADLIKFVTPIREKREFYLKNFDQVEAIFEAGAKKVRGPAQEFIKEIKAKIGFGF